MALYCGIDLHSNNPLVVVIDEHDKRLEERRLGNDLSLTLALLKPYRDALAGVAVESTFNWYWLVDGLQDGGYRVDLVNPAGIKQYEGLKYSADRYDAFWLAHLMRLGLLKTGYIYPREERAIHWEIERLERLVMAEVKPRPSYPVITTMTGVGPILGTTILLETGDIGRFESVGDYASYCRCVKSEKTSNGKKKGEGNAKSGNKYLPWAFSEAAHFAVRYEPLAKRFYERKQRKTNGIIAIRAVAHKLARAAYYMLRDQVPFDAARLFAN